MAGRRVLVALSLTPVLTDAKLAAAAQQARVYHAELDLLHVLSVAVDPDRVSAAEATARAYLDALVTRLRAEGTPAVALVRSGPAAAVIVEEARLRDAAVIVLGSTTRARLPRALLGSVADEVIRTADCPVLLVRPTRAFDTPDHLLSLCPVDLLEPHPLGQRLVDLTRIVGSATRAHELGPDFRPLQKTPTDEQRFQSVLAAMIRGEELPPVELYKLGFGYYVRDGHHRVASARQLGRAEIAATVIELLSLDDTAATRTFQARQAFEEATGLTGVGAVRPESYERLLAEIDRYQIENGFADRHAAALRWYDDVYRPAWRQVRALGLLKHVPGERTADLIARAAAWREAETARTGVTPRWEDALRRGGDKASDA